MSILNENKTPKMMIGEIIEKNELNSGEIRYRVSIYKKTYNAIPMTGAIFKPGDKVVCLFEDSKNLDTPFIVNKFNNKSVEEEKLIAAIKPIAKKKNTDNITYENDNSIFKMDDKKKKITIGNKNSPDGTIVIDNDQVIVGKVNLTTLIKDLQKSKQGSGNDQIFNSDRTFNFKTNDGGFKINAKEFVSITDNFIVSNNGDMSVETNHINFSSSFVEFNVITPKGYDLKEKNAFSFFAVMGNYSISLGTGDFNLKSVSPLSEFNFLIMPLTPFSGVSSSLAGINFSKTETLIGHVFGLTQLNLKLTSFKTEILTGLSALKINATSFGVDLLFGVVSMSLTPASFSVSIAGNKMTLGPSGLTVTTGNITATAGDVKAMGGTYSLMKHKHPTAVPGGPSPPLPG